MSYEGHTKILCENGHLSIFDAYQDVDVFTFKCPVCKTKAVWYANVDETNGIDETTGMCPGDVKLEMKLRKKVSNLWYAWNTTISYSKER